MAEITKERTIAALKQTFTELSDCPMKRMIHVIKRDYEDVALVLLIARVLVNHCEEQPWDTGLSEEQRRFMAEREWDVA
jgi:hypothetical protein